MLNYFFNLVYIIVQFYQKINRKKEKMSCFGEFFVKGSEGGVKKAVHFWCSTLGCRKSLLLDVLLLYRSASATIVDYR
jgi:hypothetical protein